MVLCMSRVKVFVCLDLLLELELCFRALPVEIIFEVLILAQGLVQLPLHLVPLQNMFGLKPPYIGLKARNGSFPVVHADSKVFALLLDVAHHHALILDGDVETIEVVLHQHKISLNSLEFPHLECFQILELRHLEFRHLRHHHLQWSRSMDDADVGLLHHRHTSKTIHRSRLFALVLNNHVWSFFKPRHLLTFTQDWGSRFKGRGRRALI